MLTRTSLVFLSVASLLTAACGQTPAAPMNRTPLNPTPSDAAPSNPVEGKPLAYTQPSDPPGVRTATFAVG